MLENSHALTLSGNSWGLVWLYPRLSTDHFLFWKCWLLCGKKHCSHCNSFCCSLASNYVVPWTTERIFPNLPGRTSDSPLCVWMILRSQMCMDMGNTWISDIPQLSLNHLISYYKSMKMKMKMKRIVAMQDVNRFSFQFFGISLTGLSGGGGGGGGTCNVALRWPKTNFRSKMHFLSKADQVLLTRRERNTSVFLKSCTVVTYASNLLTTLLSSFNSSRCKY